MVTAVEPAPLPDLLVAMLRPVVPLPRSAPAIAHPRYVDAAVRAEARLVAAAVPGERNAVLFRAAVNLSRFVRSGYLDDRVAVDVLSSAAAGHVGVSGFTSTEINRTIRSGMRRATTAQPHSARKSLAYPAER